MADGLKSGIIRIFLLSSIFFNVLSCLHEFASVFTDGVDFGDVQEAWSFVLIICE